MSDSITNIEPHYDTSTKSDWMLTLLLLVVADTRTTKKVLETIYRCPECGREWGDEYESPRHCPDCGKQPQARTVESEVHFLELPCKTTESEQHMSESEVEASQ